TEEAPVADGREHRADEEARAEALVERGDGEPDGNHHREAAGEPRNDGVAGLVRVGLEEVAEDDPEVRRVEQPREEQRRGDGDRVDEQAFGVEALGRAAHGCAALAARQARRFEPSAAVSALVAFVETGQRARTHAYSEQASSRAPFASSSLPRL